MFSLSASGARIRGDDYQHLYAWCIALMALRPKSDVYLIGLEDPSTGSVDDVTVYRNSGVNTFYQIKSSVDAQRFLDCNYLTDIRSSKGTSILQKFFKVWNSSKNGSRPKLGLITNKPIDPKDPIIILRDGRDGSLMPRLKDVKPKSNAGKLKLKLIEHIGVEEETFNEFVGDLFFKANKLYEEMEEMASTLMFGIGLKSDSNAVQVGIDTIRGWITSGKRKITIEEIRNKIKQLNLQAEEPATILSVQAIDYDPMATNADIALNWIDLYEGDEPRNRRKLKNNTLWNMKIRKDIREAVEKVRSIKNHRVLVRGYMRLPTWFTMGVEFANTAGFDIVAQWRGNLCSSRGNSSDFHINISDNNKIGGGNNLAIGVAISAVLSFDVIDYINKAIPTVGRYICIKPEKGSDNSVIKNNDEMRGCAIKIRDMVRQLTRNYKTTKIHLFLSLPCELALLLGHKWDRLPSTQLYEDQGSGRGYIPSFLISN